MYKRKCNVCGREMFYKHKSSYDRAIKNNWLCKHCATIGRYKHNNVTVLLNEELETYYWIGFLLADGHISENNRIQICLSIKDYDFLLKLKEYLNIDNIHTTKTSCSISAMDIVVIPKIKEKFDIKNNKTYNPPNIKIYKNIVKDKLLSLIIGFIDGDGCIKKQYKRNDWVITIKNHSSWIDFLKLISITISNKDYSRINNSGYSLLTLSDTSKTKELKKFAIRNNLPIMKRKWDIIDINYHTFYDNANIKLMKIKKLCNGFLSIKNICDILHLKYGCVYRIVNKYNLNVKIDENKSSKYRKSANESICTTDLVHG